MNSFLQDLNKEQQEAVTSTAKHLRIIAGAGTGKTKALTYRIAYLLSETGLRPNQLVAITFTNKVAGEMKERVYNLVSEFGLPISDMPYISTYHGFCLKFLRCEIEYLDGFTKLFTISDDDDKKRFTKEVCKRMGLSEKSALFQTLVSTLDNVKCKGLLPDEVTEDDIDSGFLKLDYFIQFYKMYQELLKKNNTLDFDDILIFAYQIIKNNEEVKAKYRKKYKAFLVDEYQDTNDLQYKLLREFLGNESSLTVVGDPDQTIYTWRGANSNLIRNVLINDFSDLVTVVLNKNYRSTQKILDTANTLINHNLNRDKKDLVAASGLVGEEIDLKNLPSQDLEAKYIANKIFEATVTKKMDYKDIAIIYRSNYLSLAIEKALSSKRIPYRIYGGHRFYDRAVIKDSLAYLKILINPSDDASVLRILKAPTRGIGAITLTRITEFAEYNNLSYLQAIIEHPEEIGFSAKSISELEIFKNALGKALVTLSSSDLQNEDVAKVINDYFEEIGFIGYVHKLDKQKEEKEGKDSDKEMDNVRELINNIKTFFMEPIEDQELIDGLLEGTDEEELDIPTRLSLFLSNVMLMSQQDEMDQSNSVNLMTVHVSKGLEFKEVFVTGLVNGVFPTSYALNDIQNRDESLEEERRMLYVALTRAKNKLHVTWFSGYNYISHSNCLPSMFLSESGLLKRFKEISVFERSPLKRDVQPKTQMNKYNSLNDIKSLLNTLPTHETLVEKIQTTGDIYKQGLASKKTAAFDFKVGMKVISTSYGIGEVTDIDKDKITAYFPEKDSGSKTVKFLNGSLAFKPLQENND